MHSRPLNYDDLPTTLEIAEKFSKARTDIWDNLSETLLRLKEEPSFVLNLEVPSYYAESLIENFNLPIPDFDETGFIGRDQQIRDVLRYCIGPYPVITLVGEGMLGKTALALRIAYDMLDLPKRPFDSIVWTSSKTAMLTPTEIVKIKGAITSSLSLFSQAASELSGLSSNDPVAEILNYMAEFKILLIIDNLETVLDDKIRAFLGELPLGSKVLITSRIGLGAYEVPVRLMPFHTSESIQLIRALSRIRQVEKLVQMPNKDLEAYCVQLKNNPGFIKWFVSAVQAGKRPEEVLANPEMFLDYCLSNVYDYLAEDSRKVLKSMVVLPRPYSQSELAFINELDVMRLQKAIRQLLTTNMVTMNMSPVGSSFESQYNLSELARDFLVKKRPVTMSELNNYKNRNLQLVRAGEQIRAEEKHNPYSFFSLRTISTGDLVVSKYLSDAMIASKKKDFVKAFQLVDQARTLSPSFFEVHRVDAQIKFFSDDYVGARASYEAALDLEPNSAPLRFWYAQFLLRAFEDVDSSLEQLKEALKLDPRAFDVLSEAARVHIYRREFSEARAIIDIQLRRSDLHVWSLRKIHDLNLVYYVRITDNQISHNDITSALSSLECLMHAFESCPKDIRDQKMYGKLRSLRWPLQVCQRFFQAENKQEFIDRCKDLDKKLALIFGDPNAPASAQKRGEVFKICGPKFGFLKSDNGETVFFQIGAFRNSSEWRKLKVGSRLFFDVMTNEKGMYALRITLAE